MNKYCKLLIVLPALLSWVALQWNVEVFHSTVLPSSGVVERFIDEVSQHYSATYFLEQSGFEE